jgi:tetratricopeptide (TPR) repeat protein
MKQKFPSLAGLARLLYFLCSISVATASHAAIDVLDGIDITHGKEQSTIHIRLSIPVSYKSHVPERSGDLLRIFVEPAPSLGSAENALLGEETIQWSPDKQVPLFDVTYEGGGFANTSITLRFQKDVEFDIPNTGDFRTIDVVIKHPEASKAEIPDKRPEPGLERPGESALAVMPRVVPESQRDNGPATPVADMKEKTVVDTAVPVAADTSPFPYVLNLGSSVTPFQANDLPDLEEFLTYRLYTTAFDKGGKTWYRLRLGFFERVAHADIVKEELLAHYPDAWVAKASVAERIRSSESMLAATGSGSGAAGSSVSEATKIPSGTAASQKQGAGTVISSERLASLMQEARRNMTDKDYAGAIRIYTKILQSPDNEYSQDAREFLGLARERKGQLAHAKNVYREYLDRYPEGEGAERVKQRLAAVVTARKQPREKLRTTQTKARDEQELEWDVFGGTSQYYRRDVNTTGLDSDNELETVSQSSLDNNMDFTGRLRTAGYDIRTRFTGGYLHDFLDDGANSDTTVSSMYFDARDAKNRSYMRLGRQSRSTGGVLGRFDGLLLGFPLGDKFSASIVSGLPVESSTDALDDTNRYFYGLTLEADGFAKGWDANAFVIEQHVDGLTDRRAVGGELRYFNPTRSFFSLVDYDIHYKELNIWQLLGNWTLPDRTTVNLVADYRKSPILTTSNAITGQNVNSVDDLKGSFSDSEINDLARDRTATSKLATLGVSRPINDKLQLSGDISALNLSDTKESGGVEATIGSGTGYIYNLQLIGSSLVKQGDMSIFGLRYADGDDRDIYSLNFNTRFPVTKDFRVNPRFRMDYRKNRDDSTDQMIYRPSLRLDYRIKRKLRLEAEIGGEYSDQEIVDGSQKDGSYFVNLGYRADF